MTVLDLVANIDVNEEETTVSSQVLRGHASTSGDDFQLNVTTLFRHTVRTHGEQEIVYRSADGGWDRYTFDDCMKRVEAQAAFLQEIGVAPGDVVGVLDWNSKRHFELYWSVPATGAALLQMNLRLSPPDLGYVVDHSGATVVLVDESLLSVAESIVDLSPNVRQWVVMSDRPGIDIDTTLPSPIFLEDRLADARLMFDWPMIDETSTYSACYTTGTTGRPKGVFYSHRSVYLHALTFANLMGMSNRDTAMIITPMFHGLSWGLPQAAVYVGAKVVIPGRYQAADTSILVDAMTEEQVTVANGAPAIYQPMLDLIRGRDEKPDFSSVRMLSGATEPPLSLMRGLYEECGAEVIHGYGATETTALISVNRLKHSLSCTLSEDEQWDLKRCQGLPLPGLDIRIVDEAGNDLPHDGTSVGEIWVRGPGIATGYFGMDDAVAAGNFTDGYWRTGDIGKMLPNGYLKLTDRLKDVIKSGGEWISSIDMENALTAHPDVVEAAVVAVDDPKWQERPAALVVLRPGSTATAEDLLEELQGKFAEWQFPDEIHFVASLPRTSVGKLDKKRIRAQFDSN
ncbi:long-chain-fatty-acid--CoA ligase [Dietzia maris]|uniref:long-chain-fatty-acid--CoA ligase n=1 Tax=Dietzia maris TaxID=37915 RepID=UPI003001EFDD